MAFATEGSQHGLKGFPGGHEHVGRDQQARRRLAADTSQVPVEAQPLPHHAPGDLRHGAAVAAPDIAARPEELVGHRVRRATGLGLLLLQQGDGGGDTGGGGHLKNSA